MHVAYAFKTAVSNVVEAAGSTQEHSCNLGSQCWMCKSNKDVQFVSRCMQQAVGVHACLGCSHARYNDYRSGV